MKQNNILNLIMGIILFIIGIALLANPVGGMEVIILILGIIMIAYGVITIISNYSKRTENAGVFGAYTIPVIVAILGILLIVFRGPTAGIVLPLIIGIWMIEMCIRDRNRWQCTPCARRLARSAQSFTIRTIRSSTVVSS